MIKREQNSGGIEEIHAMDDQDNDNIFPVIPLTTNSKIRNLVGFWLLGLCNNYPYVIMLSAAFDLLDPNYHGDEQKVSTPNRNETRCNELSTGAILLADILPSLFIKLIAPFIAVNVHFRVLISVVLCVMSFLITSFSIANWMTFIGVICAALSSGLGEVTFLSYSSFFHKNVISTWSSGTGGAGVIGALSYASLTHFYKIRKTLQIMLVMPVLTALTFWILLVHPLSVKNAFRGCTCNAERKPILESDVDLSAKEYVKISKSYTLKEKLNLLKPLLKYMIPLGIVYFAEYFINQGLMELLYFPNAANWLNHKSQYRWYQVDYQVGVLISRSSVNILQIKKIWILPILQVINLIILLLDISFFYIHNIWIVLAIIFYEGLLGGCAYVNAFYRISTEVHENDKEFSMGIASLADSMGIALAGIISLPVHDALCRSLCSIL